MIHDSPVVSADLGSLAFSRSTGLAPLILLDGPGFVNARSCATLSVGFTLAIILGIGADVANQSSGEIPPEDTVIWRYVSLPKFLSLVASQALFFARADRLGDPFEGTFPTQNLDPTYESVAEVVGPYIANAAGEKERLTQKFLDGVRSLRPKTLINCWYSSPHESAAMWGLYAGEEGGVCIQSTVGSLKRSLHHHGAVPEVFIGAVRYIDYSVAAIPMTNLPHAFWTKRISFSHEREIRAL